FMVVLSGRLFGPLLGFIYSMISVFTSASLAYFISRYLGKDFVEKLLRGKIQQLDEKAETHGFKIVLVMRLSSVFPFDVFNYALGLTKVKYKDFILGTIIGIIPETFSLTFMGSSLHSPKSGKFFIAVAMLLLTMGVPLIYKKLKKKKEEKK
ncbi:MAG: TVP38/TMEM64 family protein, partial [Clostridia bacterium]|nr:TVP38/TMEM64 family protein [Clostridia bacterium]